VSRLASRKARGAARGAVLLAILLAPLAAGAQPAALKDSADKPLEERRAYVIDGVEVRLPPPNGLTDEELTAFLLAIGRGKVVWNATRVTPRDLRLADVDFVGVSGPPRLYHIFVQRPEPALPPKFAGPKERPTVLDAQFDGEIITIVRASILFR
jgi:hypothetical protein